MLLRWEPIIRLAVAAPGSSPTVVPINFVLDGDNVIFRSDSGESSLASPISRSACKPTGSIGTDGSGGACSYKASLTRSTRPRSMDSISELGLPEPKNTSCVSSRT